ncbi:MAG: hypothetical protein LQ340_003166 [Diploschistes diacapsis]|nr:MAG: hypothetical protein LQ340_003166 [Diploschistes diacapsis]
MSSDGASTTGDDIAVKVSTSQTEEEERNIGVVKQYMSLAYSPRLNKGRDTVMACLSDLHIESYDVLFAKGGHVLLRYSATGSHAGEPHDGIQPSGKRAHWTASAIFEVRDGKLASFTKEWDK